MAYAALISLNQTLHRRLIRASPHISTSSPQILEHLATSLQLVLERYDYHIHRISSRRLNALDARIKQTLEEFEDLCELNHSLDESMISSFVETMKTMEEEFVRELENSSPVEEEEEFSFSSSSNTDFGVKMVGLSKEVNHIKSKLLKSVRPDDFGVFSFVGMAGSGRSMIAKTIFSHIYDSREQSIDCAVMVTIGQNYQLKDILRNILSQVNVDAQGDDDERFLGEHLYSSLKGKKYMILIDDIRETRVWDDLRRLFPKQHNGSLVLITTSLEEVALYVDCCKIFQIPVLDIDRTWDVLRVAIFGLNRSCPPELEESGHVIANNIEGRRLSLAKAVLFLLKDEEMPACWNQVASDTEHSVFMVDDELSEFDKIWEDLRLMCDSLVNDNQQIIGALRMVGAALTSGLSLNALEPYKMDMFPDYTMPEVEFMSVLGMPGIGKTALAKEIFNDKSVLDHFDDHVWVTLGHGYRSEEILVDVLAQIDPDIDKMSEMKGDEAIAKELCAKLSNKRCLIVLDDVWSSEALQHLETVCKKMKVKVLVTTRLASVARFRPIYKVIIRMRLLNKDESWSLLRLKVFGEGPCPFALEQAGKRILEHCDGLPLLILLVANHLCKDTSLEYWNKVADQKQNEVLTDAHSEISKALLPSYESLPQHLKPCFLYMGTFRINYEIPNSKMFKLWEAEGFLAPKQTSETVEDFAEDCLNKLVDNSVVMSSYFDINGSTSRLHSVFWHLSNSEASKSKFFHALDTLADNSMDGMEGQRRLCIRNSTLLGIDDVHDSIASMSTTRSLLCTGPTHKYPVPVCFGLKLLRVLDALTIRLYEFPIQLIGLIHLRYLALTCSGKLPASISNLCSLHFLIVAQHLTIKSSEDLLLLPKQVWDMKELKHLHTTGRSLTDPQCEALLPNLSTLLDVSPQSCTSEFFKGVPNLKKLGIQIELDPYEGNGNPFHCLDYISSLNILESLECVVVNPEFGFEIVPPTPIPMLPLELTKLSLSGLGYPWEYMSVIGELRKLQELELRCFAFKGTTWEADSNSFPEVQILLLEDLDLVRWNLGRFSFKNLELLSIKHCYQLEELPRNFSSTLAKIEAVECNPFVERWAEEERVVDLNNMHISRPFLEVESHSSWDDRKLN